MFYFLPSFCAPVFTFIAYLSSGGVVKCAASAATALVHHVFRGLIERIKHRDTVP